MPLFSRQLTVIVVRGISIVLDPSWFVVFVLLSWALSVGHFPMLVPDLSAAHYWAAGILSCLGLFVSVILHELGHSLVAIRRGLPVKRIVLFVFGGVSQLEEEPEDPGTEFFMAIVGPVVSAVLAAAFFAASRALSAAGAGPLLAALLGYLALVNLVLALFNLLPGLPLDGGRILRALLWSRRGDLMGATRVASEVGAVFGTALFIVGVLLVFMGSLAGLWYVLIGFFLRNAALGSYQQMAHRNLLADVKVQNIMTPNPVTVTLETTLASLVNDFILAYHHPVFPVMAGGLVQGVAEAEAVRAVPRHMWEEKTVQENYRPLSEFPVVSPSDAVSEALKKMQEMKTGRALVIEGTSLVGILSRRDVMDYVSLKSDLS
jgi:Zn-dependent protease